MTKHVGFKNSKSFLQATTWVCVFVGIMGSLAACQRSPLPQKSVEPTALPSPELKLGILVPTTGTLGTMSQSILEVLPLLTSTVNSCGGVNDAPVRLVVEEALLNPKADASLIKELATVAQVNAVISVFGSEASTIAELEATVPYKIPLISSSNTSSVFTERSKQGDFQGFWNRTIPADTTQAIVLAQLAKNRGFKTVSTIVLNTESGIRFEKAFIAAFEKSGGTVLNKANPTRYNPQGDRFDDEAFAAFYPDGITPDAVVGDLNPDTGSLLLQSANEQGLLEGVQLLLSDRIRNPVNSLTRNTTPPFLPEGTIGIAASSKNVENDSFLKIWQETQTKSPGIYAPQTWDAAALLLLAAEAAKSNQGDAIRGKLREVANAPGAEVADLCEALQHLRDGKDINYQGASGKVDLDANGDVSSSYEIWTVDMQGKIREIGQVEPNQ